ncbi:ATP-binding protein [Candidatus Woesearchaeota archaeon]|nr:ATP-binding protein [Candidatus Woesearchaeota archaeon]MBW3005999.1 ATP-binding protein [Candidatus Woesearchaeota archaeon]
MNKQKNPIGFINFDGVTGENNEIEIRIPNKKLSNIRRGQYVLLQSDVSNDSRLYLSRIIKGPFFQPDAVSKDSAFARAAILEADKVKFRPDFHGVCTAEVLGEIIDEENLILTGSSNRPFPQTAVLPLDGDDIEKLLDIKGDVYMGELSGYPGIRVQFKQHLKKVLPRNTGIFGTVGSGKTNTSQVLIEELSKAGWAIIVLDVEGEYVEMDKPSKEAESKQVIKKLMERFKVEPKGIDNLRIFNPIHTESNRPDKSEEFGIRFADVSPHLLAEILDLNAAQSDRFMEAYFELDSDQEKKTASTKKARSMVETLSEDKEAVIGITLQDFIDKIRSKLDKASNIGDRSSYAVVLRKIKKLKKTRVFDTKQHLGDCSDLLKNGLVSVFDMSNSQNLWINNIIISNLLNKIFDLKLRDNKDNPNLPPVIVIIEEAHSFISKERAKTMDETLDVLRDISRRGRKRWLSLCFISQQPSHLPPEIYELCNTKIVHQITGGRNLNAIKASAGGVNPAVWSEIPVIGQGRCLMISPQFRHPLMVDVRPCTSNRGMTE